MLLKDISQSKYVHQCTKKNQLATNNPILAEQTCHPTIKAAFFVTAKQVPQQIIVNPTQIISRSVEAAQLTS